MRILYNFYYGIFPGVIHTSDKYENLKRLKNLVLKITVVSPESSKDFLFSSSVLLVFHNKKSGTSVKMNQKQPLEVFYKKHYL